MSKYDFELVFENNNSLMKILDRIEDGSTVLEVGPAEGRMTKYLSQEKKCEVSIIEIDSLAYQNARQYAVDGTCTDVECLEWLEYFEGKKYRYIILADVLEHLKRPDIILEKIKILLENSGSILLSIPNIGHNKIVAKLFANNFKYTETGLLDNTHIKFWGYENLESFFVDAGYEVFYEDVTIDNGWGGDQAVEIDKVNPKLFELLKKRRLGYAYQFIVELKKNDYFVDYHMKKTVGMSMQNVEKQGECITAFYDYGEGFSEKEVQYILTTYEPASDMHVVSIPVFQKVKSIRFDPVEGATILCRILSVVDQNGNQCKLMPLNGISYKGLDIFDTQDPQYIANQHLDDVQSITIVFSYEIVGHNEIDQIKFLIKAGLEAYELRQENDHMKSKLDELIDELREKNDQIKSRLDELAWEQSVSVFRDEILQEIYNYKKMKKNDCEKVVFKEDIEKTERLSIELEEYRQRYKDISESSFWKVTLPLRRASDKVKRINADRNRERIKKGILINQQPWIAVHLHLYYEDLLKEFCEYFNNITEPFDLYISCKECANQNHIYNVAKKIKNVRQVVIRETPNRGRDIAPFYVLFREELKKYKTLLHVHSKKSLYTGEEKAEWRHWALEGVLKNEDAVAHILHLLSHDESKIGMVYGEMTPMLPLVAFHWLRNEEKGKVLMQRMGMNFNNEMLMYPVGSFFWVNTEVMKPLFDLQLTYDDFDEECGQIDGTIAHALERVIACVVKEQGYHNCIYDQERNTYTMDVGYRSFESYFGYNTQNVSDALNEFEVISFNIFDTLITRTIYRASDIYRLMEKMIIARYQMKLDFCKIRVEAERAAREKHGDSFNITHIYELLPAVSSFSKQQSEELKNLELELEYQFCIARKDSLEVFNNLRKSGKQIILISDTYLTKEIIQKILKKCGYEGYQDIWLSCENGMRKDQDTMWEAFFEEYGKYRTIHVGSNPHSDCQLVGDRKKTNMLWLSPIDEFRFSPQYRRFQRFIDTTVENSLVLGYFINKCMYNSPFALIGGGNIQIDDLKIVAQGFFAPVFLVFAQFISKQKTDKLLFLSREGLFLQKLYQKYCENFRKETTANEYFLTSRRTASVAQIRHASDIVDVLQISYQGKLKTLLRERLGIDNPGFSDDPIISLPEDTIKVLMAVNQNIDNFLNVVLAEREAYCKYIEKSFDYMTETEDIMLVDVGYAGTIQYYLMKLLNRKLRGCYLATEYNVKPLKLGGECESVYSFKTSKVFEYAQLFLESATAAPHGQVLKFEMCDEKEEPVFKENKESCWESAQVIQQDIFEYVEEFGLLGKDVDLEFDSKLAEAILDEIRIPGILGDTMKSVFTVFDDYCMGGKEWSYNCDTNQWEMV